MVDDEQCGEIKNSGEPCENPVKYADGKCGIHSDINGDTQGRPTKFNDERAQLAIEAAREGKSVGGCERAAGVGEGTVRKWLDQDHTFEDGDGLVSSFFRAFAQARAEGESRCLDNARSADGNASFEKFMLASSFDYKKTEKQELTGEGGGSITINTTADTDE